VATYVNHNFTNSLITTSGGFSVSMDVTGYNQATINQGAAFGIGMTAAEAAAMRDAVGNSANETHMSNAFGSTFPGQTNAVADFWLAIRGNNTLVWGNRDTILGSQAVAAKTGTITANFWLGDFNAGSNVFFEVLYNGTSQATGNFQWSDTNANYLGLDGRDNTAINLDNLTVSTIPEPATAVLGLVGLAALLRRRRR
jgi:MYXO-CTERM domain-containing protein